MAEDDVIFNPLIDIKMGKKVYFSFFRSGSTLEDLTSLSSLQLLPRIPHRQLTKSPPKHFNLIFINHILQNPMSNPPWYTTSETIYATTKVYPAANAGHFQELVSLLMVARVARQGMYSRMNTM